MGAVEGKTIKCVNRGNKVSVFLGLVTLQAITLSERRQSDEDEKALHKYLSFSMPQDLKAPPPLFPSSPPCNNLFINCW